MCRFRGRAHRLSNPWDRSVLREACQPSAGCVMSTIRKRARVIDEVYGPGFHYRTPLLPPGGIYLAPIHTRVRIRLTPPERGIICLFALTKGLRQKAKGPCRNYRLSESRFAGRNIRATVAPHGAAHVCRLICAKGPTGEYLIGRTVPQSRSLPKKRFTFPSVCLQRLECSVSNHATEKELKHRGSLSAP